MVYSHSHLLKLLKQGNHVKQIFVNGPPLALYLLVNGNHTRFDLKTEQISTVYILCIVIVMKYTGSTLGFSVVILSLLFRYSANLIT